MSGNCSRKYPSRCIVTTHAHVRAQDRYNQRKTVERDTPIARASRAQMITIVAFL